MKKAYTTPLMRQNTVECCTMMAMSGINSNNGIGYGGVDYSGDKDAAAREFLWDIDDIDE